MAFIKEYIAGLLPSSLAASTNGGYISNGYLGLYTNAEILALDDVEPARVEARLAPGAGRRVLVSSWVLTPQKELLAAGVVKRHEAIVALLRPQQARWKEFGRTEAQVIWEFRP